MKILALVIVVLVITLAGCTSATSMPAATVAPSSSALAVPVAATTSADEWLAGHGGDLLNKVEADLSQLSDDTKTYDLAALAVDGQRLSGDAAAAAADPPPVQGAEYVSAMSHFAAAGTDLASGDISAASNEVSTGAVLVSAMSDVLNGGAS